MGQFFAIAPIVFMFLIPALTMQSFSDEKQKRTLEFLTTKPLTDFQIVMGKYLACFALLVFAIFPTLIYYLSIVKLGSPVGNIDSGAVIGSYIGLLLLAAMFTSIGIFTSSLTENIIVSFVLATFISFLFYWAFEFISTLPLFYGKSDAIIKYFGIEYHYDNISRGRIDTRDVIYFLSIIAFFIWLTLTTLGKRKWR